MAGEILRTGQAILRAGPGLGPVRAHGGNLLRLGGAPLVGNPVWTGTGGTGQPPPGGGGNSATLFDYATAVMADQTMKIAWPMTMNQFDRLSEALPDGRYRDWQWTLNGPQHRFGGVRYYWSWWHTVNEWVPHWQPAARPVQRVYRKGTSGQALRTLVFECYHNTATVPVGDQVWFYLLGTGYEGQIDTASTFAVGGFTLNLKQKMTVTGGAGSPDQPSDGPSTVEVTFGQDLPAVDVTLPRDAPMGAGLPFRPRLVLTHHSFWANAATKTLRKPLDWHFDILKTQVLPAGGHVVLGGSQGNPTWRDWTELFNWLGTPAREMYAMEQQGLAEVFGATDPKKVCSELENETVRALLPAADNPVGSRAGILDVMYPTARAAWGADRTLVIKPNEWGSLDGLYGFDITNAMLGNGNNLLGAHDYADRAPHTGSLTGPQAWFDNSADCSWYANRLADTANSMGYKGAIVTEYSAPNTWAVDLRGRSLGKLHTALTGRSIPLVYWSLTGGYYSFTYFFDDVPGSQGHVVEAILPELRQYCGKSGRSV